MVETNKEELEAQKRKAKEEQEKKIKEARENKKKKEIDDGNKKLEDVIALLLKGYKYKGISPVIEVLSSDDEDDEDDEESEESEDDEDDDARNEPFNNPVKKAVDVNPLKDSSMEEIMAMFERNVGKRRRKGGDTKDNSAGISTAQFVNDKNDKIKCYISFGDNLVNNNTPDDYVKSIINSQPQLANGGKNKKSRKRNNKKSKRFNC
jgi:hypothetical protein